jgi:predicted nucleic acid-binding protein
LTYADTDFFVALAKESDWLKASAERLLREHLGRIWTSPATLIELLLLSAELRLDPETVIADVLKIARLRSGDAAVFLRAAKYIKEDNVRVFDALHAATCGADCPIISSDRVFDRLGMKRIPLEQELDHSGSFYGEISPGSGASE